MTARVAKRLKRARALEGQGKKQDVDKAFRSVRRAVKRRHLKGERVVEF